MMGLLVSACGAQLDIARQVANDVEHGSACEDFSGKLSATLAQALIDDNELPLESDLRAKLEERLRPELVEKTIELYRVVVGETREKTGAVTKDEMLAELMALEIGDETTPAKAELKGKIRGAYASLKTAARAAGLECPPPEEPSTPPPPLPDDPAEKIALPAAGAIRVMTTAYQNCEARRLPAMTSSTPNVQGIKITGRHENGVGQKREIGDLKKVQQTHYYVKEGVENDPSCYDVTKTPPIYDYGGKPYATTATDSPLDLFRNAGSGTPALGIDCSGYVFSALAASGLRVSPTKRLTASLVYGINAKMYMDPAANGLSCLAPVPSVKDDSLRDGDILASSGHVVMVDRVGEDPFGIAGLKSASECVTSKISVSRFDFDILQSSPVKEGIGIDRMRASAYLPGSSSMKDAMVSYAVAACKAKFGSPSTVKPSAARLVRHKLTAECMDRPVALARESCVRACPVN